MCIRDSGWSLNPYKKPVSNLGNRLWDSAQEAHVFEHLTKLFFFGRSEFCNRLQAFSHRKSLHHKTFFDDLREGAHIAGNSERSELKLSFQRTLYVPGYVFVVNISGNPGSYIGAGGNCAGGAIAQPCVDQCIPCLLYTSPGFRVWINIL